MFNIQRLSSAVIPSRPLTPGQPAASALSTASKVIRVFHPRNAGGASRSRPVDAIDIPEHARQRIEYLLRDPLAEDQPSLAAQISQRLENAHAPLADTSLHSEVEQLLNRPSALNPQRTYAQLIQEILESPPPAAPNAKPVLSRARRDLQNAEPTQDASHASVRQFAEALVEDGDRQLSINFANHLIRQWVQATPGRGFGESKIAVPPGSTFGLAWNELADALDAQPFKAFAQAQAIDISSLVIKANGDLSGLKNNQTVSFSLAHDPDWAEASSAVLAAAKKIAGDIRFHDRGHATADDVGRFYRVRRFRFNSDDKLHTIDQLLKDGTFSSLSNTDSYYAALYAPIQQEQKEAKQQVANLPWSQLDKLLTGFTPLTATQKVQEDDRALARLCSRVMGQDNADPILQVPEYSTFNQMRKTLIDALNGPAFTAFVRDNNLEVSSILISSSDGTLIGRVNGVETTFVLNDLSDWASVWPEVQQAVEGMATGSGRYIYYPSTTSTHVSDVLSFYAEDIPDSYFPEPGWRQKGWNESLRRSAELTRNDGFKALVGASTDDARSRSVRSAQQAVASTLAGQPLNLSPLETLAAEVKANRREDNATPPANTAQNALPAEDPMASAESALAVAVQRAMLDLKGDATNAASTLIDSIPANTLFGQWWAQLGKALNGRGLTEWARQQHVDPASLRFDPVSKTLIGKVNGMDQRFAAADFAKKYPDHFDALTHLVATAEALVPNGKPITLAHANGHSAPYECVSNFYGIDNSDYSSTAFANSAELIGRTQAFPEQPINPVQSLYRLNRQKTALGDSNNRYALMHQLKHGNIDNDETTTFTVDPDSSHEPKGATTVQRFLLNQGWYPATWAAQVENLTLALQTPIPQAPPLGNRWGFLSTDVPLSEEQRSTVIAFVQTSIGIHTPLISYLSSDVDNLSADPEQALDQLLSSDKGQVLANALQTEMKGAATPTSLKQWLLTALVLDLDRRAGTQRNSVTGFDVVQRDNWGYGAEKIRERFSDHLTANKKIAPNLAPVAARLLMSGMAAPLLVKDLPSSVTLGSPEWVSFTTAVNRIEQLAPGASAGMTYQQVMGFHQIKPISAAETQSLAIAQTNPVMDWAIINNHVVKNDKDEYSLEQLTSSQQKIEKQIEDTADARRYLRTFEPPNRRAMALNALKSAFGNDIDFESRTLWESLAGGAFSGIRASIVDIYEAGRLDESWHSENPRLNVEQLRAKAPDLPDINQKFNEAIQEAFTSRRGHTVSLFKDMLSKLPLLERNALNYGAVELLQVEGAGSGIVMTSVYKGERRDFALYPAAGKIIRIPDIDPSTPLGQKISLTIDAEAFKNGAEPRPGIKSDVVLRISDQFTLIEKTDDDERPELRETLFLERSPADLSSTYDSERMENLAKVLVDTTYLRKSEFIAIHRGRFKNAVESGVEPSDFFKGVLHAIPGVNSAEDIYHGEFVKAAKDLAIDIAIYVATEGAGKLWNVAKSGATWAAAKVSTKFIEKFGAEGVDAIALKDVTAAGTSQSFSSVNRMQDSHLAEGTAEQLNRTADMADGAVIRSGATAQQIKLTAVLQDGKWYAYNPATLAAYGPALEGFVSDTSSVLRQETFSDGTQALVTEQPLAADAYSIPRANGFDLVDEGKVYRYDPKNPGLLTDLESADHYKPLDNFEAICAAPSTGGGRVRRGANDTCFSKIVENVSGELTQELQALEHVRLFPSPPKFLRKDQFVIFERRRYKMVESEMGPQLQPVLENKPITYKSRITGSIKQDPQFGIFFGQTNEALTQETRVIKLNSLSDICDDKREVRGVIVRSGTAGSADRYLVIEADTAQFYYAKLNNAASGELSFLKCTPNEISLINSYRHKFSIRQGVSRTPLDAQFIALPKLDAAFSELERSGYPKNDVDALRGFCKDLTKEQQREVLFQLQRTEAIGKLNIALTPNRVPTLTTPENFATLTAEQKNKFFAQQARNTVNRSMKATGLGPSNQIRSQADIKRAEAANMIIGWLRRTYPAHALNRSDLILKSGAGNCGEMALLSKDIIKKSGGHAYEWGASEAHAFTVVGGPTALPAGTVDFSGPAWADAWIVDPWADIACPAREYTQKLKEVMTQWEREGLKIVDPGGHISPLEKNWMDALIVKPKTPFSHGYNPL